MSLFESAYEMPGELHEWELSGPAHEASYEAYEHGSGELNESLEMELAHELLEITSEAELEQFLGKLVSSVGKAASGFIKSPIGKALGGVLKNVAKTALPVVGSALGSFVAPGIGTAIGGKLGSMASNLLEVGELEMMSEAEAEFEAAHRYVRWARGTTRNAMRAPWGTPPSAAVRAAAVSSARRYAPALLASRQGWRARRPYRPSYSRGLHFADQWAGGAAADDDAWNASPFDAGEASGRWVRRGSRVVLFDV